MDFLFVKLLIFLITLNKACVLSENLTNVAVVRLVTFANELVKVKSEIEVQNNNKTPAEYYEFHIDPDTEVCHIGFVDEFENNFNFTTDPKKNIYFVQFGEPLRYLQRTSINVKLIHMDQLKSLFKNRKFNEENILRYSGNALYYSKYETLQTTTQYYAGSMSLLSENDYSSIPPTSVTNNSISYNFADKAPFSERNLKINLISNTNYYRILNFDRTIDVSIYGMITIIDNVILKNNGPPLIGPFEPNFPRDHTSFKTRLPYGAYFIKYYDEIGLIQSYQLNASEGDLSFDFKPRYPLHSGWKVAYSVKYLIPIYNNVQYSKKDGTLELNFHAFGNVLKNILMDQATCKILLPEGSSILSVKASENLVRKGNRKVFTSLSLYGRKAVEFNGKNMLDYLDTNVKIQFKVTIFHFLRVPLLITSHLFALFLIVIFVYRYKSFGS